MANSGAFTANQKAVIDDLLAGTAIPVGKTSDAAGPFVEEQTLLPVVKIVHVIK